ncbi:hypothetical protein [Sphingomonas pruni]|uniref:hypothetical protein n=1 Tax=Sphingomonas pruni TaxID=40683 RepID=UPI0008299E0E|nr:hypothetical protein [Sphingomonas pruni]
MTKPLMQRLDDVAKLTGIPDLARRPPRRRPLRGLALFALVLGTVGMAVTLLGGRVLLIGDGILLAGFVLSGWLPLMGPIKPWMSFTERVDELDAQIRAKAYLTALPIILFAAVCGLVGLPILAWMQPRPSAEMVALGGFAAMYLLILWNAVPTLHASWRSQPIEEQDD